MLSIAAYVNLVLFFLQTRAVPVIPNLQDVSALSAWSPSLRFERFTVDGHDIVYSNDLPLLQRDVMPVR